MLITDEIAVSIHAALRRAANLGFKTGIMMLRWVSIHAALRRAANHCGRVRSHLTGSFNPRRPKKSGESNQAPIKKALKLNCFNPRRPKKSGESGRTRFEKVIIIGFNPRRPKKSGESNMLGSRQKSHGCFNPRRPKKSGESVP